MKSSVENWDQNYHYLDVYEFNVINTIKMLRINSNDICNNYKYIQKS